MLPSSLSVPYLHQMAVVQIAIRIANDEMIVALTDKYGPISHILPDAASRLFLNETRTVRNVNDEKIKMSKPKIHYTIQPTREIQRSPNYFWEILVLRSISTLQLPKVLHRTILGATRAVSLEVDRWMQDHSVLWTVDPYLDLQSDLIWMPIGKIDRAKTAKSFIRNENIDIRIRYILACLYFYEDAVFSLWGRMALIEQEFICELSQENKALNCWTLSVKGESVINWNDLYSVLWLYPLGLPIINEKLDKEMKKFRLVSFVVKGLIEFEYIYQCLSPEEFDSCSESLKVFPQYVLRYLLEWPFQGEFLKVASRGWTFLSTEGFQDLLKVIVFQRIMIGRDDFDYVHLLEEFWKQSQPRHKKSLIKSPIYDIVLLIVDTNIRGPSLSQLLLKHYGKNYLIYQYLRMRYIVFKEEEGIEEFQNSELSPDSQVDVIKIRLNQNLRSCSVYREINYFPNENR
ncbi:uncharacterized protein TNIN_468951 [Trichonephila inaurata madagascariensis]|uniref:Uncharacterized protein n=1 Tax=Trichonephila inaurata madagascariensis TaxID=2747483 RepID=A0A8X6YFP5_9ARAC|nr:uncharacterized protein TNIN_468951 [Trichonephila inaurata madagascariensis]